MAEFERPDDTGTTTDTTPIEPRSEAAAATDIAPAPVDIDRAESSADTDGAENASDAASETTADGAPKKRRRRGSRGGRGRKRPAGSGPNAGEGADAGADSDGDDDGDRDVDEADPPRVGGRGEDWTDAAADRGLTSEDLGDDAREDAGLPTRNGEGRPRIGDSRPAPAASAAAPKPKAGTGRPADADDDTAEGEGGPKKRRRRRGGRGRSRPSEGGGSGNGNGNGNGGRTSTPNAPSTRGGARKQGTYVDAGAGVTDVDVDGTAILESLDEETLERRRGTRRKGRPAGRYLMVVHERDDGMAHIGVLEGRTLVEHYVALPTDDTTSIDGNIYLGRVQNVLPGMEAAFIDIGTPKNGVLYRGDVVHDDADLEGGAPPRIERMLRNGQSIIVQVTKNPIAHKGARLTQEVSLAGRFVVMVPGQPQTYGISKRLPDDERKRLRRILDKLRPSDAGLIVRTAAEGATDDELERDLRRLNGQWQQISELAKKAKPGSLLYKEPPLAIRLIREEFTKEYRGVVIDAPTLHEEVRSYVDAIAPELADRIEQYDAAAENLPLVREVPRARAAAQGARPQGLVAVGWIARDRAHRGADRDRREHRQERRDVEPRGNRLPEQPRSGRGGRA